MALEKKVKDALRTAQSTLIFDFLQSQGYEPMYTAAGTLYYLVDGAWVKNSTIIPNASEEEATDGYSLHEDFEMKCEEKAQKAEASAKAKAEKIAKDKAKREAKKKKEEEAE